MTPILTPLRRLAALLRPAASLKVPYEQAVYGSFAFWDRGYAMLAQSAGCRPEWLAEFRQVCQRYGEQPTGTTAAPGMLALRLKCGPWLIAGAFPQGRDDHGRPGALAFHGLFVEPRDYRRAGTSPFGFAGALHDGWTSPNVTLAASDWTVSPPAPPTISDDERAPQIVEALTQGRRVAMESPEPIEALAERIWSALPMAVRARASVATWAYANGNRFDLVALPRLKRSELDVSYLDPAATIVRSSS